MTKTPSALKWLAEKRARLANEVEQAERIAEELDARRNKLRAKLSALDETIRLYDEAIDPNTISSVNAWQGRYGKRGALRETLLELLGAHAPGWVSSINLEFLLLSRLGITFLSAADRERWRTNCLCAALNRLQNEGLAERERGPQVKAGKPAYWRLKQATALNLADL